jgi:hypothetical protein
MVVQKHGELIIRAEQIIDEAYKKGWEEACDAHDLYTREEVDAKYEEAYDKGYQRGLDDAWECARICRVRNGGSMSKRKWDLPIVIAKNSRKGIMGWLDRDRRAVVSIVWLNKDVPHGEEFQLADIDKTNAVLWFCDRESIDQTIKVLEKLKKGMPQVERVQDDA